MTEKLKQIIKDELVKLPKESQEVINTFDWGTISEDIGKKYLLNENEINGLQVEIALVLLGIVEEDSLSLNIESRVGTSKNEAIKIIEETNQKIFNPMLEKIEEITKNKARTQNPNWNQRVDFIISGGDYSVFIEKTENISGQKIEKVEYREAI